MMKKLFTIPVILLLLWGCDKIDEPLKGDIITSKGCNCETDANIPFVTDKNVLIEEFTGIKCNNCPEAADQIEDIQSQHPDRVKTIAIHASGFAIPDSSKGYPQDYRTDAGSEIFAFSNAPGVPSGLVSRTDYGKSNFAKLTFSWESKVDDILQTDQADIGLFAEASVENDTICLKTHFRALTDLSGRNLKWCAFLTESGIVSPQMMSDNSRNENYEHKHMLRAPLNGTFGSAIDGLSGTVDEAVCSTRALPIDDEWVIDNCEIVVYVYEESPDSREVLQVVTASL